MASPKRSVNLLIKSSKSALISTLKTNRLAVAVEFYLILMDQLHHLGFEVWHSTREVVQQHGVHVFCQIRGARSRCDTSVGRMSSEELLLRLEVVLQVFPALHITETSADDTDKALTQRVNAPLQNAKDVGAVLHQVDLGDDADRSIPIRVNLACHAESI